MGTLSDPGRGRRKFWGHLDWKIAQNRPGTLGPDMGLFWPQTSYRVFGGPPLARVAEALGDGHDMGSRHRRRAPELV